MEAQRRRAATRRGAGREQEEGARCMISFLSRSIPLGSGGAGEDELLLVGGGYLLVEIMEAGVVLGVEEGEIVDQRTDDIDRVGGGLGGDLEDSVIGPGGAVGLGRAFNDVAGRQAVGDVILLGLRSEEHTS